MQRAASGGWKGLGGSLCVRGQWPEKRLGHASAERLWKLLVVTHSQTESLSDLLQSALLVSLPGPDHPSSSHQVTLWGPVSC